MTYVPTLEIVRAAEAGGYGVAAVNIVDDVSTRAVIAAAAARRSPVIIQTSVKTVRSIGSDLLHHIVARAAAEVDVPVSLHLDHCPDRAVISECLHAGWHSVLFDASDRPLEQAMTETTEVVAEAHAVGAAVEAEVENIKGVEDGVGSDVEGARYPVEVLASFVEDTGCDMFAPALGTAHGMYKSRPRLDPPRAAQLRQALSVPIVLHGGTGLTDREFAAFIAAGCSKINISTSLKRTYMQSALTYLEECRTSDHWDPPSLFRVVGDAVADDIAGYYSTFGSEGKA